MRLFTRSAYPVSRVVFELVIAIVAIGALAWAWRADLRYCERHLLRHYFAYDDGEIDVARRWRLAGALVGASLLFIARPIVGRWAGQRPLRRAGADLAPHLAAIVLAVAVAEGMLRALGLPHPPDRSTYLEVRIGQPDARYGWLFRPSTSSVVAQGGRAIRYDVNADHDRAPSVDDAPDPAKPVIVFAGESIVEGHGLAWEDTLAGRVGDALGVPVVDLGVDGYGSDQAFLRLVDALPRYEHPLAVITFFIPAMLERMDRDDHPHLLFDGDEPVVVPATTFWTGLHVAKVLRGFVPYRDASSFATLAKIMRETERRARARDAVALFVAPQFDPPPRREGWMADELFRAQGLAPVDLEFGFKPLPEDVHPDVESTHRLADAVIAALRERLDRDRLACARDPSGCGGDQGRLVR